MKTLLLRNVTAFVAVLLLLAGMAVFADASPTAKDDTLHDEDAAFWTDALRHLTDSMVTPPSSAPVITAIRMNRVYYTVTTTPLGNTSDVTSTAVLFVPSWDGSDTIEQAAPSDVVCMVGEASMLEADLQSFLYGGTNCTAANGCGVHVHAGVDCTNSSTQLGHWYNLNLDVDPWARIGYLETDQDGYAKYATCVRTGFEDLATTPSLLEGRAFVVHSEDGSRVSCGLIEAEVAADPTVLEAKTVPIVGATPNVSNVNGQVVVLPGLVAEMADSVCYQGYATGLEPNVESFLLNTGGSQCNVTNGCGAHIHAGVGCADAMEQLGHYYDPDTVAVDPWLLESYYSTDSSGTGAFVGCAITGDNAAEYVGRPFIVHGTDGSRLSCGILS